MEDLSSLLPRFPALRGSGGEPGSKFAQHSMGGKKKRKQSTHTHTKMLFPLWKWIFFSFLRNCYRHRGFCKDSRYTVPCDVLPIALLFNCNMREDPPYFWPILGDRNGASPFPIIAHNFRGLPQLWISVLTGKAGCRWQPHDWQHKGLSRCLVHKKPSTDRRLPLSVCLSLKDC